MIVMSVTSDKNIPVKVFEKIPIIMTLKWNQEKCSTTKLLHQPANNKKIKIDQTFLEKTKTNSAS